MISGEEATVCFFIIQFHPVLKKSNTTLIRFDFTFIRPSSSILFYSSNQQKSRSYQEKKKTLYKFETSEAFFWINLHWELPRYFKAKKWKRTEVENNMNKKVLKINLRAPSDRVYTLDVKGQHATAQVDMTCKIRT